MKTNREKMTQELQELAKKHRGVINPRHVVEFAKNPKTALHGHFEWNNSKAAEEWRLHQARNLLRVIVTVTEYTPDRFRVFASLPQDRNAAGGYRMMVDVLSDKEHRAQLLEMALAELRVFREKHKALTELAEVFAAIDRAQKKKAS